LRAKINQCDARGATPLLLAAKSNSVEILKQLLHAKADIDGPAGDGHTPLYVAAKGQNLEAVQTLMHARAKISAATQVWTDLLAFTKEQSSVDSGSVHIMPKSLVYAVGGRCSQGDEPPEVRARDDDGRASKLAVERWHVSPPAEVIRNCLAVKQV